MDGSGNGQRSVAENESNKSAAFNSSSTNRNPFQLGLTAFGSATTSTPTFQLPSFRFGAPTLASQSQSTSSHQLFERSIPTQQTATTRNVTNVFSAVTTPNVFRGLYKFDADKTPNIIGSQKSNVFAVSSTDCPIKFKQDEALATSRSADSNVSVVEEPVSTSEKTVAEQDQSTKIPTPSLFSQNRNVRSGSSLFGRAMADVKSNFGTTGSHLTERPAVKKLVEDEAVPLKETVFLSPGEISRFTAIVCRGIPDSLNNKQFILEHFAKFGKITKINCNTRKGLATVHFESGSSAVAAKQNGAILRDDLPPLTIFFSTSPKVSPKSSPKKSERPGKVEEIADDINEELRAMEGSQSSDYVVFTEKPAVEEIPTPPVTKSRTTKSKSDSVPRQNKDNQSSDSPKYSRSDNTESLNSILNTPALTTEEKFNVLQVRDKLIRLKLKRHSDINTAIATAGICPDMCPEKERYLREDKRQLHYYETKQLTDKEKADGNYYFDSKLLVKEYSRSSADQEEPLSHELRPTEILDMTMNYLLCNIVQRLDDGSEDNATDWFDFLWNRTRAIRKDITQQHLCNQTCVALVEKCARFHIHCSVRLCEEDMINFDSKINNENLTKCLQTLKHFYADLAALGEKCPNEPEFQAYNVLLNLNEGDILRHVQHLSPEVRQSPQIGFALQVFSALNSNNYVRFFKLVKKADYLSACVLHRYFLQIRVKTLYTIMKVYSPPNHHAQFSLDKLVSILVFDNDVEALHFFNSYGLVVENNLVVLDRNKFCEPDSYVLKRPRLTLESKKMAPVAVILNGGVPLAPNPIWTYEPHVSFESNGLLKTSAIDAKDQLVTLRLLSNCGIGPAQQQQQMQKEPLELSSDVHSHASPVGISSQDDARLECVVVSVADDLLHEVTQEMSHNLCTLTVAFYNAVQSYAVPIASALIGEELSSNMKEICEIVIEEAVSEREETRRKLEYEERKLMEKIREQVAEETQSSVTETVIADEAVQVVHGVISEMWTNDFLVMALRENITRICVEIHSEECMLRKRRKMIDAMIEKRKMRRMQFTIAKWRSFMDKKRNRRRSMENFPTSFIEKSSVQIRRSSTGNITPVISPPKLAARRKYLSKYLDTSVLLCSLSQQLHTEPFDLRLIADPRIPKLWPSKTDSTWLAGSPCWKLCVELTQVKSDTSEWMKQKFAMDKMCRGIVEISVGLISELDSTLKMLFGSQGIIYVHDTKTASLSDAEPRLMSLVSMKPLVPAIPLLIVTFSEHKKRLFMEGEQGDVTVPQFLTEQGLLSDWMEIVVNIDDNLIDAAQSLHSGLCWLADKCPKPPNLVCKRLDHFIEDTVQQLFTENVHSQVDLGTILTWPSLFNNIVEHAATVASDESLANYSWPPSQSINDWNNKHNLQDINQAIVSLKLPPFICEISEDSFWEENCKLLMDYVQTLDNPAPYLLMHRIELYMLNVENQFSDDELIPQHLPWTYTFNSCFAYQIDKLKLHQQGTAEPTMVVYDPEKLNHFDTINASTSVHTPRKYSVLVKRKSGDSAIMDVLPSKRLKESAYDSFIANNGVLNEMCTRLKADVEAGKDEMSKCERFLEGLIGTSFPDDELSNQSQTPEINTSYQPDLQKMSFMEQLEYLKLQVSSCKQADANLENLLSRANYGT